jgi:RND superfamily putative drug exporter
VFAAWGSWVARLRRPAFAVTLIGILAAGVWGIGVFGRLSEGGYTDPGSESSRAADLMQSRLGGRAGDMVVIYTPVRGTIDDAVLSQRVENMIEALPADKVSNVASYWPGRTAQYSAADKSKAVAVRAGPRSTPPRTSRRRSRC